MSVLPETIDVLDKMNKHYVERSFGVEICHFHRENHFVCQDMNVNLVDQIFSMSKSFKQVNIVHVTDSHLWMLVRSMSTVASNLADTSRMDMF
jgi:hypothetical protein